MDPYSVELATGVVFLGFPKLMTAQYLSFGLQNSYSARQTKLLKITNYNSDESV